MLVMILTFYREHIYRRHLKFQCIRCGEVFGKAEHLKGHQRSSRACENINPKPPSDAINQEQKEKIRSREGLKGMSEPEKWIRIYKIIYPDARTPFPSPCESMMFGSVLKLTNWPL